MHYCLSAGAAEAAGGEEPQCRGKKSGGDAPGGNTRTHAEHESEGPGGRWYYAGDGMEEQEAARLLKKTTERFLYRILVFTSD